MRNLIRLSKSNFLVVVAAALLYPVSLGAQDCTGPTTTTFSTFYLHRDSFNEVQAEGTSFVTGDYWDNWDTFVSVIEKVNGVTINAGFDSTSGGQAVVEFFDAPEDEGTGTWSISNHHEFDCGSTHISNNTSDTLTVSEPEIQNLPASNALWYFGPGTPGAVPAHVNFGGGYAYQYANLTFAKNCGGGDDCGGSVTWGEIDMPGAISITSGGVLTSTNGHSSCSYDSAVSATLDGWTISELIFVNKPTGVSLPAGQSVTTVSLPKGYGSDHPWAVNDNCGYLIPSMAVNETFGSFSEHASVTAGWSDPTATSGSGWADEYFFTDRIGADGDAPSWVPDPVYTGPGPTYSYSTKLKWGPQKWYIGTTTFGSGTKVFDGTAEWYQDHGTSY